MAKTELTCPICGRRFVTDRPNKKYCGLYCAEAGRRQLRAKWEDANPKYNTIYMRSYRAAKKEEGKEKDE